jgi:hypothetical protein
MGGFGSGQHKRSDRWRVEDCTVLSLPLLLKTNVLIDAPGSCTWHFNNSRGDYLYSLYVDIRRIADDLLQYYIRNTGQVVLLRSTALHFGGCRWWFACPDCDRRCSKLYLPPRAYRFLCRRCHNLRYNSASDRSDIVIARLCGRPASEIKLAFEYEMDRQSKPFIRKRDRRPDYKPQRFKELFRTIRKPKYKPFLDRMLADLEKGRRLRSGQQQRKQGN